MGPLLIKGVEHRDIDVPIDTVLKNGTLDIYPELARKNVVKLNLRGDKLFVAAGGVIGIIPLNDRVSLDIRSKVPIKNLERLLAIAETAPSFINAHQRLYDESADVIPDVVDLFAAAILSGLEAMDLLGAHKEYVRQRQLTSQPRGRPVFSSRSVLHLKSPTGPLMEWAWFWRTADIPVNRCIRYAVYLLAQQYQKAGSRNNKMATALAIAYERQRDITLDHSLEFLRDRDVGDPARFQDNRPFYRDLVNVSRAVISGRAIAIFGADPKVTLPTMIVDMNTAFERYVRHTLSTELKGVQGLTVVDGNNISGETGKRKLFDTQPKGLGEKTLATPDIVIARVDQQNARPEVVLEVKYKICSDMPDREDLNQLLVYALSHNVKKVAMVYPCSEPGTQGIGYIGRVAGIDVYKIQIDLDAQDLATTERAAINQILSTILNMPMLQSVAAA